MGITISLAVALIITIALTTCLILRNGVNAKLRDEYKQKCEKAEEENKELQNQVNMFARENDKLKKEIEKSVVPMPVIKEVVMNPKIQNLVIKRILSEEQIRFGGEQYKEFVKKQMIRELAEGLVENDFVEFFYERDLMRMEETITARVDVVRR